MVDLAEGVRGGQMRREDGIRPVIKHRECYSLGAAHNVRIDDETCHHRSLVEALFFALRERFGTQLEARTWFGQLRAIVPMGAVRNLGHSLNG